MATNILLYCPVNPVKSRRRTGQIMAILGVILRRCVHSICGARFWYDQKTDHRLPSRYHACMFRAHLDSTLP
ncbi:MAG: hypothetical protein AAF213_10430 [Pseudomonadota bacterium]